MSWNSYTDRLVASKVELCAIHGINGAPWAQVPGFQLQPDEVARVANSVVNNDSSIYGSGVVLWGKKWTVICLDSESRVLVLKGKEADNHKQTLVLALSAQAVIIGANKTEEVQGGQVRTAVEGLKDYLKQCGY
jgi:hypothetical protein